MADSGVSVLPGHLSRALSREYRRHRAAERGSSQRMNASESLLALIHAGQSQGWPLRLLAKPCRVTPERLRQVIKEAEDELGGSRGDDEGVDFPLYIRPPLKRTGRNRSALTPSERRRLRRMGKVARTNSGSTKRNPRVRKASEEFSTLIIQCKERGVTWDDLAKASGLSPKGVRFRALRHGYGNGPPPSIKPYQGVGE